MRHLPLSFLLTACGASDAGVPRTTNADEGGGCGAETCSGCCTAEGACQSGDEDASCGTGGELCADCAAVDTTCKQPLCWNDKTVSSGVVDDSEVHLQSPQDIDRLREDLIDFVWGGQGLPLDQMPDAVLQSVASPTPGGDSAAEVDRLEIDMDGGFVSIAYLFWPAEPSGGLMIYHQGHADTLGECGGDTAISFFLDQGTAVLAFYMPLYGENTGPVDSHDAMMALRSDTLGYDPLRWFLEPVVVGINYALATGDFDDVGMIGISGGGWTTTWLPALDTRIRTSFPVAGSLPLYLRTDDFGDDEQYDPSTYAMAGYEDLYVLGGSGTDRLQVQVLNRYDSCCFSGLRFEDYEESVTDAIASIDPGSFSVFVDESHQSHMISDNALEAGILHAIDGDGVEFADDLSPPYGAYSNTGTWTDVTEEGFDGEVQEGGPYDPDATATWTFTVPNGLYRVSATWSAHETSASDAVYTVSTDSSLTATVDQRQSPSSREDGGAAWEDLGEVAVDGTALMVTLSADADGTVIADGVRVEPVQ